MKKSVIIIALLFLLTNVNINVSSQAQPAGIAGYVWLDGKPAPVGLPVIVKNNNTGEYANTTTVEHEGKTMYATSLSAEDGHEIIVMINTTNYYGYNFTIVNLSKTTQWCNLSLQSKMGKPMAFFSYSPTHPYVFERIHFYDSSYDPDGYIVYWTWYFGDGSTSHEKNPIHSYSSAGTYKVTLIVRDNDGNEARTSKYVRVYEREEEEEVVIPPLPPPKYPEIPYTVPQMYELVNLPDKRVFGKVKIAVIDTGYIPRIYEDLENNISVDMTDIAGYSVVNGTFDGNGHGSWVNYAVHWAVENRMPNAIQYSIRAFDENGRATIDDILSALDLAEKLGVDVVSCSWGYIGELNDEINKKVREMRDKGIIVVCAGGNYGPSLSTIVSPAMSPATIAVGATDPMHTIKNVLDDRVTNWSSRGPVYGVTELKPDGVCGGESIKGPWLYGEKVASGTSMATPVVAGSIAYMIAKEKPLFTLVKFLYFWNKAKPVDLLEDSLEESAVRPLNATEYDAGHGTPNIAKALRIYHWKLIIAILEILLLYIAIILLIAYFIKKARRKRSKY